MDGVGSRRVDATEYFFYISLRNLKCMYVFHNYNFIAEGQGSLVWNINWVPIISSIVSRFDSTPFLENNGTQ